MKILSGILSLFIGVLTSCGGGLPVVGNTGVSAPTPPIGATTVSNPLAFLEQTVCDDGSVDRRFISALYSAMHSCSRP